MTAYTRNDNGNWAEDTKWTPTGVPGAADTVNFSTYNVRVNGTHEVLTMIGGTGGTLRLLSGDELTVHGNGSSFSGAFVLLISPGTLKGSPGTYKQIILANSSITIEGASSLTNIQFLIRGAIDVSDLFGNVSWPDMLTCGLYVDNAAGALHWDLDFGFLTFGATHGSVVVDPGLNIVMKGSDAGAWMRIGNDTTFEVNGTAAAPVTISPSVIPSTNKLEVRIHTPNAAISNLRIVGVQTYLGDSLTSGIAFSRGPRTISPLQRPPKIDSMAPLARKRGRIHYKGNEAGTVEIDGSWRVSERQWAYVDQLKESGTSGFFVSEWTQLPYCKVLSHEPKGIPAGRDQMPYELVLIEDG